MSMEKEMETYIDSDGLHHCTVCHKATERLMPEHLRHLGMKTFPAECDCKKAMRELNEKKHEEQKHHEIISRLKSECFDNRKMWKRTFAASTYDTDQMKIAHQYVSLWSHMSEQNNGLLFWGAVGTGKSYTAACIANALTDKEIAVKMTTLTMIMNDLIGLSEGKNKYLSRLCEVPLLILDDFGMERGTEYGLEQSFQIVDMRINAEKPMIVTTNLTLGEMQHPLDLAHQRIYDRVLSVCTPVSFTGSSLRAEKAIQKLETMRGLLREECA